MDEQMSSISNTKLLVLKTMWFVLNYFPIYYSKYIRYMLGAWMYRCIVLATLGLEDHVVCVELFSDILLEVHKIYVRIMDVQMYSISNTKLLILKTMWFVFDYFPIYYSKYIRYMLGSWMYRCTALATIFFQRVPSLWRSSGTTWRCCCSFRFWSRNGFGDCSEWCCRLALLNFFSLKEN